MADSVASAVQDHAGINNRNAVVAEDGPMEKPASGTKSALAVNEINNGCNEPAPDLVDGLKLYEDLKQVDGQSVDTRLSSDSRITTDSQTSSQPASNASSRSPVHRDKGDQVSALLVDETECESAFNSDGQAAQARETSRRRQRTVASWWIGYPNPARREKDKEREERVRKAREKLAQERKQKLEELKEQQRLAQEVRDRQQELRRRKIEELRRREEERRSAVEERRRQQEQQQKIRREAILQKAQQRVARYELWKQYGRNRGGAIGFGSRTPREICMPLDRKRSSSHSTLLRRSPNDSDSDSYVRPQRRAVSACSMVRRHCCIDVKPPGSYPASVPPSKHLSVSTSVLYYKRSPEFSSTGTLSSSNRPESLLALNTIPEKRRSFLASSTPQRPRSTIGLQTPLSGPPKVREFPKSARKPRPASIASSMPGFIPLDLPASDTSRSKSSERISRAEKMRHRPATTSDTEEKVQKTPKKGFFDRLSLPKREKKETDGKESSLESNESVKKASEKKATPTHGAAKKTKPKEKSLKDEKAAQESPATDVVREPTPVPVVMLTADDQAKSSQEITEGEYKAKLAEKRRQAREKAEREAELERQRQEELRRQEEEQKRQEEEDQRKLEEEALRLAEEARIAEEERLRKAIEAEEQRKKEEAERIEQERKAKEEAEKKAKEEAERTEKERIERAKKEEEERLARKKRLEMIMKRVKTDPAAPEPTMSESPTKSLTSSPSRSSNSSMELSEDKADDKDEVLVIEQKVEENAEEVSQEKGVEEEEEKVQEEEKPKFRSPLLKQLMNKRTEESTETPKFKSSLLQNILTKTKIGNWISNKTKEQKNRNTAEKEDKDVSMDEVTIGGGDGKNGYDADKDIDTSSGLDNKTVKKEMVDSSDTLIHRLSPSYEESQQRMDDSGFSDSDGSMKTQQAVNGTGKLVDLGTDSAVSSLVENNLDNKDEEKKSGDSPWNLSGLTGNLSGPNFQGQVPDISERVSTQSELENLLDLSLANRNIELKSQQLQESLINSSDDLLNFNSIDAASADSHRTALISFEDNAGKRQDVAELI